LPSQRISQRIRRAPPRFKAPQTFTSLRHSNFRLLWTTSVLNGGSNWLQQVTLGWLAFDLTGSAITAAMVFGLRSLPNLLMAPLGGALGDRFSRKRMLQLNSGFMAVVALWFAVVLATGFVQVWHILLITLLHGLAQALVQPVRQAMVANTVPPEDLTNAVGLDSFAMSTMRLIGPAVAGVLIALSGPALNFAIQSGAYVLIFLLVLPLQSPYGGRPRQRAETSLSKDLSSGLQYAIHQPTVFGLILLAVAPALFTTPIQLGLLPVFAREALNVGSDGLGLLYSMQGVGAVIATLALASFSNFRGKGMLLSAAILCQALAVIAYSQITLFVLALPFLAMATCSWTTFNTLNQMILQMVTPDEFRARVMGLRMMDNGVTPLGSLIFGAVAEVFGISTAILIAGLCGLTVVLVILVRFPAIRTFRTGTTALNPDPPGTAVAGGSETTTGATPQRT
jgi:MFS family permease